MKIGDLVTDKTGAEANTLSLSRSVALTTFVILSLGFLLNAYRKMIPWEVYIAYPIGVIAAFIPQLFLRMLDGIAALRGGFHGRD